MEKTANFSAIWQNRGFFSCFPRGKQTGCSKAGKTVLICALREPDRGAWKNIRECSMKKKLAFAAALLAASVLSGMANAKTLVYCSEASPANFDPGTTTGGNDFDASSRTVYSRLVEFKHGGTEVEP